MPAYISKLTFGMSGNPKEGQTGRAVIPLLFLLFVQLYSTAQYCRLPCFRMADGQGNEHFFSPFMVVQLSTLKLPTGMLCIAVLGLQMGWAIAALLSLYALRAESSSCIDEWNIHRLCLCPICTCAPHNVYCACITGRGSF